MAQLAIRGHATRGREVIELLEMLGGKNINRMSGDMDGYVYIINHPYKGEIDCLNAVSNIYKVFTLEEFLEKFPYKVGDKVSLDKWSCTIEKMYWDGNSVIYYVKGADFSKSVYASDLQPHEEETMKDNKVVGSRIDFSLTRKVELELGDTHEVIVEDGKTYVVRKKPQYPKTYEECAKLLNTYCGSIGGYNLKLLSYFQQLLICRDAYWKIAGDWKFNFDEEVFYFCNEYGKVCKFQGVVDYNASLAFPTEEMRDAFYENFKDLLESCKELL